MTQFYVSFTFLFTFGFWHFQFLQKYWIICIPIYIQYYSRFQLPAESVWIFLDVAHVWKWKIRTPNIYLILPYLPLGPFIITMSESPEAPEELPENFETKVIAQLTISLSQEDSKGKVKESKSQKINELIFTFLDSNYVEFLQMLLAKHLQDKYELSNRLRWRGRMNQLLRSLSYPFGHAPHPKNIQTDSAGNWKRL